MRAFLFMKYKLAFVKEVKEFCHMFYYSDELKELLDRHYPSMYEEKFAQLYNNRWTPLEIFEVMEGKSKIKLRPSRK